MKNIIVIIIAMVLLGIGLLFHIKDEGDNHRLEPRTEMDSDGTPAPKKLQTPSKERDDKKVPKTKQRLKILDESLNQKGTKITMDSQMVEQDHHIEDLENIVFPSDTEGIKEALRFVSSDLSICIGKIHSKSKGKIELVFKIDKPDENDFDQSIAKIFDVDFFSEDFEHEELENCIFDLMGRLRFELPKKSIEIKKTFMFSVE